MTKEQMPPLKLPKGAKETKTPTAFGGWWGRILFADGRQTRAQWRGFPEEAYTKASRKARADFAKAKQEEDRKRAARHLSELRVAVADCLARGYYRLTGGANSKLHNQTGCTGYAIAEACKTSIPQVVREIALAWLAEGKELPKPKDDSSRPVWCMLRETWTTHSTAGLAGKLNRSQA